MASPRCLAASMAMARFSFSLGWPVKSASRGGTEGGFELPLAFQGEGEAIPFSRMWF